MASSKLQSSLESGIHGELNKLTGSWKGIMKTYFDGVNPINEAPVSGTIRPLFDGRFVQHEYKSSFEEKPFEGIAIYGYNLKDQQYESAWVDTFHMGTGIMFSSGKGTDNFNVTGEYSTAGSGSEVWKWRTEITITDKHNIVITAYNIETNGSEAKAIEILYERVN